MDEIKYGKYKGYEVFYANKGQIFPRKGWYLMKSSKSGKVKDIKYLEACLYYGIPAYIGYDKELKKIADIIN